MRTVCRHLPVAFDPLVFTGLVSIAPPAGGARFVIINYAQNVSILTFSAGSQNANVMKMTACSGKTVMQSLLRGSCLFFSCHSHARGI